ncbi:MAG: hypothetical protein JO138_09335 [Acidobacteriaceae bacterium]|nr:hypothetical protein [Acidobacteriaceae bacterium]
MRPKFAVLRNISQAEMKLGTSEVSSLHPKEFRIKSYYRSKLKKVGY